jgi:hypothetical protein
MWVSAEEYQEDPEVHILRSVTNVRLSIARQFKMTISHGVGGGLCDTRAERVLSYNI